MVSMEKMNTRDRIIRASLELFTKKGYVATTTKEIAELATISEVTLFRHFKSKEMIFRNMVEKYLPKLSQRFNDISVPNIGSFSDNIAGVAREMLSLLQSESRIIKLTIQMPEVYPVKNDDLYGFGVLVKEKFKAILIEQYNQGKIKEQDWDLASRGLAAILFGYFLMEAYYSDLYNEETTDMIVQFVKGYIKTWEV